MVYAGDWFGVGGFACIGNVCVDGYDVDLKFEGGSVGSMASKPYCWGCIAPLLIGGGEP